jgi:hypothetical protein
MHLIRTVDVTNPASLSYLSSGGLESYHGANRACLERALTTRATHRRAA